MVNRLGDILLTGASGVIGSAVATRLHKAGYRLHLAARNTAKLAGIAGKLGKDVDLYAADLSDANQCQRMVSDFFKNAANPAGLICNAGNMGALGLFADVNFSDWERGVLENFLANAAILHRFAREFKQRGLRSGSVIVLSGAGIGGDSSFSNMTSYSAGKAALVHLVEALGSEWEALGLRINAVAPGPVLSGMTRQALAAGSIAGEQAERARDCQEKGGVSPDLTADAIEFLLSEASRPISGRLLSARFDITTAKSQAEAIRRDSNAYRLRRIDGELFTRKTA
jgi:NAD(P)-dependent dehydrogenase (short-subunit alcohol dehydrogenase family)